MDEYDYLFDEIGKIFYELDDIANKLINIEDYEEIKILEKRYEKLIDRIDMIRSYREIEEVLLEIDKNEQTTNI